MTRKTAKRLTKNVRRGGGSGERRSNRSAVTYASWKKIFSAGCFLVHLTKVTISYILRMASSSVIVHAPLKCNNVKPAPFRGQFCKLPISPKQTDPNGIFRETSLGLPGAILRGERAGRRQAHKKSPPEAWLPAGVIVALSDGSISLSRRPRTRPRPSLRPRHRPGRPFSFWACPEGG